jgi:hypothetical protein
MRSIDFIIKINVTPLPFPREKQQANASTYASQHTSDRLTAKRFTRQKKAHGGEPWAGEAV